MTRRVAITGVLAVCVTALIVGVIAYALVARDARRYEDRLLLQLANHPGTTLAIRDSGDLAQVRTPGGPVLYQTDALARLGALPALRNGYASATLRGHHLRVYTKTLRGELSFSVALSDAPARASLTDLRRGVLIATISGALLVSLALVWITRRGLARVGETASVADRIVATGDLNARVPEPAGDDEIARLARSMNRMLTHLQVSDTALRRMVADASHELRSPVTTVRGNLELLTTDGALSLQDRDEALADTLSEAQRLGQMVEDLLTLARADTVVPAAEIALLPVIQEALAGTEATLEPPAPGLAGATVNGDAVALRGLVRNLVENAERYGGGAELSLTGDRRWFEIRVRDHGPGIAAEEREAVFGRFTRGSSSSSLAGSGLGLAIVAATAQSHGGGVSLEETPGGGATFIVRLPRP